MEDKNVSLLRAEADEHARSRVASKAVANLAVAEE